MKLFSDMQNPIGGMNLFCRGIGECSCGDVKIGKVDSVIGCKRLEREGKAGTTIESGSYQYTDNAMELHEMS